MATSGDRMNTTRAPHTMLAKKMRLTTLAASAVTIAACVSGGMTAQRVTEPVTDRSIEATVPNQTSESAVAVLVQGSDLAAVADAVRAVGGEVTHELGIINAVGARLTPTQRRRLEATDETLRIRSDRTATVSTRRNIEVSGLTGNDGPRRDHVAQRPGGHQ